MYVFHLVGSAVNLVSKLQYVVALSLLNELCIMQTYKKERKNVQKMIGHQVRSNDNLL
jgi:hypothetical protein